MVSLCISYLSSLFDTRTRIIEECLPGMAIPGVAAEGLIVLCLGLARHGTDTVEGIGFGWWG